MPMPRLPRTSCRPFRFLTAAALLLALLPLGCHGCGKAPAAQPTTVVVALQTDMQGVNEVTARATSVHTALHYFALFLTLLDEQPDWEEGPPTYKPRLAESYEFSPDRKELVLRLRRDALWSDGVPITAQDVRWTWQVHVSPEIAWPFAATKERISDVEVVDEHTVRFHFTEAYATQLSDVNFGVILPRHAWSERPLALWQEDNRWFVDHGVYSGPFVLESWEPLQRIILARNDKYFAASEMEIDRVVFRTVPDRSSRLAMLRSGEAHLLEGLQPDEAIRIRDDPGLSIVTYLPRQYVFVAWNMLRPMFAEKEVRQALTLAIDRQAIIDAIYYGYARVGNSPFMENVWAHNKDLQTWPYDPVRATQKLAAAGWTDSDGDGLLDRDGVPFRFEILTNADNDLRIDTLVMLKEQLRRVGIDAIPRALEFNTVVERELAHDFEAALSSLGIDTSLDLTHFFHTRAADGGYNFSSYSNAEVDRLLEEITLQVDAFAAKERYDRIQAILHEEQPVTFVYEPERLVGVRKELENVQANALSTFFHLETWRLREE